MNISPAIAEAIAVLCKVQDHSILHLSAKFDPSISDIDWITRLKGEGDWVIISSDPRITTSTLERAVWRDSGLTAFFMDSGFASKSFWVQAAELVRFWPIITKEAKQCAQGCGFLLKFRSNAPVKIYDPSDRPSAT